MSLTFIDLFAGVGGFRRGMELAGHKCIGFCEWDRFATYSYTSMHLATNEQRNYLGTIDKLSARQKEIEKDEYKNGEWYSNDIRNVDATSVPKADVWCFGAPCQDFSIAGQRKGLEGDRSSLIREVFRIVGEIKEEDRPQWLIYENVKGMFSSNKGFDYLEILFAMDELGYDIEWQLFNSKDWGVPQNRERVYTIGHLRRYGGRKILPITGNSGSIGINQIMKYECSTRDNPQRNRVYGTDGIAPCLNTMEGGGLEPHIRVVGNLEGMYEQNGRVYGTDGVCASIAARDYKDPKKIAIPVLTPDRINKRQNGRRFKENEDPMFKLTAQDRHGVMVREPKLVGGIGEKNFGKQFRQGNRVYDANAVAMCLNAQPVGNNGGNSYLYKTDNMRIRKLTPKECFRLQGWTDEYFDRAALVNSDSQLYKQAGNGVTVNVVYEIAKRLEQ